MNLNKYLIAQSLQYLQWLEFNSWEISWWVMQTSIECHLLPQVSQDFFHAEHCLFLTFPISIMMLENNRLDSSFIFMHLLDRMIAIVAHRCYLGDFISVQIFILSLSVLALHDPDRHWPTLHHQHHLQKYHFLLLMLHETVFIFILFCNIWKGAPLLWFDLLTFPLTSATILAPFTPKLKTAMTDYKIDSQCFCTKTGNG